MEPKELKNLYSQIRLEAQKALVGLDEELELLVVALFSGGHVLLEGVPGTAKTLMAKTLAHLVQARFTRIQFTPDLMPSDILGTNVFDLSASKFYLRKGPLFTQILLADEINRSPAKTQAALLEAMEEKQINLDGERYQLEKPFMVIATQNPVEFEGTYPLPEAQLDRFMFKIIVPYSPLDVEVEILQRTHNGFDAHNLASTGLTPVLPADLFEQIQIGISKVIVEPGIIMYIARLAAASRQSPDVILGASPRASNHVLIAAKTLSGLRGKDFVTPDDVKTVLPAVYRHRLLLKPEAEIEGLDPDTVIKRIMGMVDVPR